MQWNRELSLGTASSSKSSHPLSWGMQGSWPPMQRVEDWKNTSSLHASNITQN